MHDVVVFTPFINYISGTYCPSEVSDFFVNYLILIDLYLISMFLYVYDCLNIKYRYIKLQHYNTHQ